MKLRLLFATVGCCALLCTGSASAFMVDPDGNTNFDGSAKFTDPDEQLEAGFMGAPAVAEPKAYDVNEGSQAWFPARTALHRDTTNRDVSPR